MKRMELQKKLASEEVNPFSYSLEGGLPNEAFCLGRSNNIWEVYYSERGLKSDLKTFYDEDEACEYFYKWMKSIMKNM